MTKLKQDQHDDTKNVHATDPAPKSREEENLKDRRRLPLPMESTMTKMEVSEGFELPRSRRELWKLLAEGPEEYRPVVEGALLDRYELFQISPDQGKTKLPFDALLDRWIAIVRDHGSELRGPGGFSRRHIEHLAQFATFAISVGRRDWKIYRHLAHAAELGARVMVIENDMDLADFNEWEDFLDQHVPWRLERRRRWSLHTLEKLKALRRSSGSTDLLCGWLAD